MKKQLNEYIQIATLLTGVAMGLLPMSVFHIFADNMQDNEAFNTINRLGVSMGILTGGVASFLMFCEGKKIMKKITESPEEELSANYNV